MVNLIKNQKGALTVICLLSMGLIVLGGFGTWSILRHWRKKVEAQLQIDQCLGQYGLKLKATLNELSASNSRLKDARVAALMATLTPAAKAALLVEIQTEYLYQEAQKAWINSGLLRSTFTHPCEGYSARMTRESPITWKRLPPDERGSQPFQWQSENPHLNFELRESHGVHSAVELSLKDVRGLENESKWSAQWANLH